LDKPFGYRDRTYSVGFIEGMRVTEKRIIIAGGAGFIGSHLSDRLLVGGCRVVCVDNLLTGSRTNVAHLAGNGAFELVEHDVTDGMPVGGRVDAVVYLASPASPVDYRRFPIETLRAGSVGLLSALDFALRKNCRFVYASSSEVYGDPLVHPQREDYWGNVNPIGPRAVYDEAKRFGEAVCTAYRDRHGLNTGIVRLFNTYGPRMRTDDGRMVPAFVDQALRGVPLTVHGTMVAADHPGPINLGNPVEMTVLDVARLVLELTGSASPLCHVPPAADDPRLRRPDIDRARRLLGWRPAVDPREGLGRTIAWFADRRALVDL
jgi:dTDP-glucose 4,6-dehydratase